MIVGFNKSLEVVYYCWTTIYTKIVVLLKRGGLGETHNFKKMLITHAALLYAFIGGISPMDE